MPPLLQVYALARSWGNSAAEVRRRLVEATHRPYRLWAGASLLVAREHGAAAVISAIIAAVQLHSLRPPEGAREGRRWPPTTRPSGRGGRVLRHTPPHPEAEAEAEAETEEFSGSGSEVEAEVDVEAGGGPQGLGQTADGAPNAASAASAAATAQKMRAAEEACVVALQLAAVEYLRRALEGALHGFGSPYYGSYFGPAPQVSGPSAAGGGSLSLALSAPHPAAHLSTTPPAPPLGTPRL